MESSKLVKPWRQDVVVSAVAEMDRQGRWVPISGPVHLVIEFFLPRPKNQPKTRRTVPKTAPDLDKLVRATGDALKTAGVYRDDALVTDITTRKRYAVQDEALGHPWELPGAGAVISVFAIDDEDTWADRILDSSIADRLPMPALPEAIAGIAGHSASFEPDLAYGQVLTITADLTDAKALVIASKALAVVDKREQGARGQRTTHSDVVVVVEQGLTRLASVPGKPLNRLQEILADVCARGAGVHVEVLIADRIAGQ